MMARFAKTEAGIVVGSMEAPPFVIGWDGAVERLLPSDTPVSLEEVVGVLYGVKLTPPADRTQT